MPTPSYRGPNPHLRALWGPPLYATAMGSVEVTPPPKPPYRRLYHLLSAGFATSNIALQRMKVARWSDLNDRFELNPYVGASSHDHRWFKDREVILGPECSQSLDSTRRLVDKVSPGVVVIQARRAANHFKVVPDEATVPRWADSRDPSHPPGPTPP